MCDVDIQGCLWGEIVRRAFRPLNEKDEKKWMSSWMNKFELFEGYRGIFPPRSDSNGYLYTFSVNWPYNLYMDVRIKSIDCFSVCFKYRSKGDNDESLWVIDVDPNYFHIPDQNYSTEVLERFREKDPSEQHNIMMRVVDGLIIHPKIHLHLKYPPGISHDIRVGTAIDNVFVFLFSLFYQFYFSIHSDRKKEERQRLVELFTKKICENSGYPSPILPGELFPR